MGGLGVSAMVRHAHGISPARTLAAANRLPVLAGIAVTTLPSIIAAGALLEGTGI